MESTTAAEGSTAIAEEPPSCSSSVALAEAPSQVLDSEQSLAVLKTSKRWSDWRWQIRNRIRSVEQLQWYFPELKDHCSLQSVAERFPMAVTPYYASLIRCLDSSDPVFQMCVPQAAELWNPGCLREDPLEEDEDMPVPGLVHRYSDRALLLATTMCSTYCRHCTRKRVAGCRETSIGPAQLRQATEYLRAHPEIKDVIVSGGDPFVLSTPALERVLMALRSVPTVEVIRIGTRTPVVLPQRITDDLVQMLRKYHPIWVNTHFNHPNELTAEAAAACVRLVDAGIPVGNQAVLLRGINDDPQILEMLFRGLVRTRVRPYYLFQCDLVRGVEHFRTPLSRGIEIMEYLRGRLSGLAIPTFVVDAPHGGGKIPVLPNYIVSVSPTHTVLRNFEGMLVSYPEPNLTDPTQPLPAGSKGNGVWALASGRATSLVPANNARHQRRKQHQQSLLWAELDQVQ